MFNWKFCSELAATMPWNSSIKSPSDCSPSKRPPHDHMGPSRATRRKQTQLVHRSLLQRFMPFVKESPRRSQRSSSRSTIPSMLTPPATPPIPVLPTIMAQQVRVDHSTSQVHKIPLLPLPIKTENEDELDLSSEDEGSDSFDDCWSSASSTADTKIKLKPDINMNLRILGVSPTTSRDLSTIRANPTASVNPSFNENLNVAVNRNLDIIANPASYIDAADPSIRGMAGQRTNINEITSAPLNLCVSQARVAELPPRMEYQEEPMDISMEDDHSFHSNVAAEPESWAWADYEDSYEEEIARVFLAGAESPLYDPDSDDSCSSDYPSNGRINLPGRHLESLLNTRPLSSLVASQERAKFAEALLRAEIQAAQSRHDPRVAASVAGLPKELHQSPMEPSRRGALLEQPLRNRPQMSTKACGRTGPARHTQPLAEIMDQDWMLYGADSQLSQVSQFSDHLLQLQQAYLRSSECHQKLGPHGWDVQFVQPGAEQPPLPVAVQVPVRTCCCCGAAQLKLERLPYPGHRALQARDHHLRYLLIPFPSAAPQPARTAQAAQAAAWQTTWNGYAAVR